MWAQKIDPRDVEEMQATVPFFGVFQVPVFLNYSIEYEDIIRKFQRNLLVSFSLPLETMYPNSLERPGLASHGRSEG